MSDLISRQTAIEAIESHIRVAVEPYQLTRADTILNYAFEVAASCVFNLPSAEPRWISVKEKLPKDNVPVNITWINRQPEPYYKHIKDVPFTATGVYFRGKWYWYSSTVEDYLAEYGRAEWDEIEESMAGCIEVTAWMPLPEAYEGGGK